MLVFFSAAPLAASQITTAAEAAVEKVEKAGQESGFPLLSGEAPVLAAVALIGLVGIARRRRPS